MRHRYLGIFLIAFFLQAPTGDCFGQMGEIIGALPSSYPASNDPGQTAAEGSEKATLTDDEVQKLREAAMSKESLAKRPLDYSDIDKAIAARPSDAGSKMQKAAMLRLDGKVAEAEAIEALAYTTIASRGSGGNFNNKIYHAGYANLLDKTSKNAPDGPTKANMVAEMCAQVRAAWQHGYDFKPASPQPYFYNKGPDRFEGVCGNRTEFNKPPP